MNEESYRIPDAMAELQHGADVIGTWNYCPHCGADMRE